MAFEQRIDPMTGNVTVTLPDGRWITIDGRAFRELGLEKALRFCGYDGPLPTERVAVYQHGEQIGSVPAMFEPYSIKSTSPWYQPRGGDFERDGDKWIASRTLGPGDLEAVPGFVWKR